MAEQRRGRSAEPSSSGEATDLRLELARVAATNAARALRLVGTAALTAADTISDLAEALSGDRSRAGPAAEDAASPSQPADKSAGPAAAPEIVPEIEVGELPVAGWDELTVGSIRARLRSLDVGQLVALRAYEQQHGDRPAVVTMLDNRIARVRHTSTGQQTQADEEEAPP